MLRRIASLTALFSFLLLMLTSIVLYIVPSGRVAYWSDYRLWGLSRTEWGDLHLNLGVLLLLAVVVHTCYNGSAIVRYLQSKTPRFSLFSGATAAALTLTLLFLAGTYAGLPPFSTILQFGDAITDRANAFYGEPPYGHAELSSLQTFTGKMELDLQQSLERLREAGLHVANSGESLKQIAAANGLAPNDVYLIISPLEERRHELPRQPPAGMGKTPLIELCQSYSVDIGKVLRILENEGIAANETQSLKQIAARAGTEPHALYELLRNGVSAPD